MTGTGLTGTGTFAPGTAGVRDDGERHGAVTTRTAPRARLAWRQELITMALSTWLIIGLFVDGWAHTNLTTLETFFTPWHALFYSGFVATAGWILWQVDRGYRAGKRGLDAVPAGYALGLVGIGVFALGGLGDMAWHTIFGIEVGLDALYSPTHLLLYAGVTLTVTSPLRAAWSDPAEPAEPGLRRFLPVLLSATLAATALAFMFMYLGAFRGPVGGTGSGPGTSPADGDRTSFLIAIQGVTSVLATNLIVVAPLLLLSRRWRLPFGAAAVLLTTIAALTNAIFAFEYWWLIPAAALGGLGGDAVLARLRPSDGDRRRFWAAGALVPLVVWSVYFAAVAVAIGIDWVVELWTGSIFWAALHGITLAVLMRPPAVPTAPAPPGGTAAAS